MSDDEFDETSHDKLLASVLGRKEQVAIKKSAKKLTSDVLISSIKHAKTAASLAKERLELEKKEKRNERIKGAVGFIELKKDLKIWDDVVKSNRLADQLCFPLNEETLLATEKPADRAEAFKPKTEFEKKMFTMWNGSKNNMTNDTVYTEAELEVIRAMDIKEAREKLSQMQKMRALISYREAKYRYAAKIKSKRYHRILKRQKRKQLIKEFDELLIRDPEAAKEKLEELENQRIIERGSLKHRARTKFQQDVVKYAGRDARAQTSARRAFEVLQTYLLGRELKSKVSVESSSEEDDEDKKETSKISVSEMIKNAAVAAARSSDTVTGGSIEEANNARIALYELRAKKRLELEAARKLGAGQPTEPIFEHNNDWTVKNASKNSMKKGGSDISHDEERTKQSRADKMDSNDREIKEEDLEASTSVPSHSKTTKKKAKEAKKRTLCGAKSKDCTTEDIDVLFNSAEEKIFENLKVAQDLRDQENKDEIAPKRKKMKKVLETNEEEKKEDAVDISLDPKHFLQVESTNLSKVSSELMDKLDEFDEDQAHVVAEAFKDDDVIGDFEEDKEFIEEGERPKGC
ncbi:hypothetical protein KIN20_025126 [Parelaphostrongylus tenuis]|uniref:U3 small nucleolar RNA-associated protein 14 n=1 Tax=Parelaphostrongylus tenuis TaxID=148309 RepID=A0AAD5QWR4_PARTN|nr:hypothetical protein KIN20_025126 [Parelaphostrongylus tenuis]